MDFSFIMKFFRFAFKLQRFFADMIKDEDVKTEFKLNDFDVITGLFEVLEESDENLTYLLLETIFLFARVKKFLKGKFSNISQ